MVFLLSNLIVFLEKWRLILRMLILKFEVQGEIMED